MHLVTQELTRGAWRVRQSTKVLSFVLYHALDCAALAQLNDRRRIAVSVRIE